MISSAHYTSLLIYWSLLAWKKMSTVGWTHSDSRGGRDTKHWKCYIAGSVANFPHDITKRANMK